MGWSVGGCEWVRERGREVEEMLNLLVYGKLKEREGKKTQKGRMSSQSCPEIQ